MASKDFISGAADFLQGAFAKQKEREEEEKLEKQRQKLEESINQPGTTVTRGQSGSLKVTTVSPQQLAKDSANLKKVELENKLLKYKLANPKAQDNVKSITPTAALNFLSDSYTANKLKKSNPELYKRVVAAAEGRTPTATAVEPVWVVMKDKSGKQIEVHPDDVAQAVEQGYTRSR